MHDNDIKLLFREPNPDGTETLTVRIEAAGLTRRYIRNPETEAIHLDDEPLLVGGYDMTSIIGKRVREWVRGLE